MNKLYFGDNLHILREHIKEETVDLIYLDPLAWVGPHHRCSPRPTSRRDYSVLFKTSKGHESGGEQRGSPAQITAFEDLWSAAAEGEKMLTAASPVFHVDRIRAPLMVIQGAKDPRVNIDEANQIVEALRSHGIDVPYILKENEGHGFRNEERRSPMISTASKSTKRWKPSSRSIWGSR